MASNHYQSHAASKLERYRARSERKRQEERDHAAIMIPALTDRCCHLPGNNYCQDWYQYLMNNHPLFGICCHHKLHPLGVKERIVILFGSVAFGLIMTNIFFLGIIANEDDFNSPIVSIAVNSTMPGADSTASADGSSNVTITYGMVLLWTVGTSIHALFDLSIWYLSACACCLPGGRLERVGCCKRLGSYVVVFAVVLVVAAATVVVVYRASMESQQVELNNNSTSTSEEVEFGKVNGVESFDFLLSWAIEVAIALLVTYPLWCTILFTGVLGCGRLPFLGGRPREMWLEEQTFRKMQRRGTEETESV